MRYTFKLIAAEFVKMRVRSFWALALAGVATGLLPALGFIAPGATVESVDLGGSLPGVLLGGVELSAFLVMLLAVMGTAGEFQHRTAVGTFLATPRRHRVVVAKVAAYTAVGGVVALTAGLVSLAVVPPIASAKGFVLIAEAGDVLRALLAAMAVGAIFGAFGVGIGGLVRNQTAAALTAFLWFLVVESIASMVIGDRVGEWLPGNAAAAVAGVVEMGPIAGIGILLLWAGATAAAGAAAIATRDVA